MSSPYASAEQKELIQVAKDISSALAGIRYALIKIATNLDRFPSAFSCETVPKHDPLRGLVQEPTVQQSPMTVLHQDAGESTTYDPTR